jgi:hypothetical protein|tara:strand:+ start:5349 stop:5678 length:330 start_codon:yes stop_codon:yes gene_type:complete
MPTFTTYKASTLNTTTGTTLVTCGTGQHFLHSVYVANVYGSAMGITVKIEHADATVTHVAYKTKLFPNETVDLIKDNKIYLLNGDKLIAQADKSDAFTINVSLLDEANS